MLSAAGLGLHPALAAEGDANAYLLLNIESDGILSARDLVFTNRDSGEEVWFRDLLSLGRAGSQSYLMEPLPAGVYYLSRIYPNVIVNDAAPSIEAGEEDGVITLLVGSIN